MRSGGEAWTWFGVHAMAVVVMSIGCVPALLLVHGIALFWVPVTRIINHLTLDNHFLGVALDFRNLGS